MPTLTLDREKIILRRKALGLTQHELANRSGVSRAILSLIESGKRSQVEMETLSKLASGLQVDALQLLITPEIQSVETEEDRVVMSIRRLLEEYPHLKEGLADLADRRPRLILRALEMALEIQSAELAESGQEDIPAMPTIRSRRKVS